MGRFLLSMDRDGEVLTARKALALAPPIHECTPVIYRSSGLLLHLFPVWVSRRWHAEVAEVAEEG